MSGAAIMEYFMDIADEFWLVFSEMAPYLLFGFFPTAIFSFLIPVK